MEMHPISVIISNFNGAKYLPRLLSTLHKQEGVELEIIVVDRYSSDDSDAILAANQGVKVIKHPPETGLVDGYARGMEVSAHDLLFFMNEDMWLEPHCLSKCADFLLSRPRVAAVMPVQWTYDGVGIVNAGIWFEKCFWNRRSPTLRVRSRWHLVQEPARVSYANAGACLVRRSANREVGGWDRSFFLDDEDTDLSIRFWQRGWESWVVPDAIIGHAVGASNQKELKATQKPVSRKRYVSAQSNFLVLGLKTFAPGAFIYLALALMDRVARNLVRCRFQLLGLDLEAIWLTLKRLPAVFEFREANRHWNQKHPGELFFKEPAFQAQAIAGNVSAQMDVRDLARVCE